MKGSMINLLNDNYFHQHDEITPLTMAVIPVDSSLRKKTSSLVLEETGERVVKHNPTRLVDLSCHFFGSSLRGRLEGTASIAGITHKAPIIIDSPLGMYYFPTTSPYSPECIWLSHSHIEKIVEVSLKRTEVYFINRQTLMLDISFHSMQNQIMRTAQFRFVVENRNSLTRNQSEKKQFINPFAKESQQYELDESIFQVE